MPEDRPQRQAERAREAYASGLRTTLRGNARAYGFSVMITATFALVSHTHPSGDFTGQVVMFATAAALAFLGTEAVASRMFRDVSSDERERVVLVGGALDVLSILAAIGCAVLVAKVPGPAAWPLAAAASTWAFLLVGGLDILVARRVVGAPDRQGESS